MTTTRPPARGPWLASVSGAGDSVSRMPTRATGTSALVSSEVAAANAAYVASLHLAPLTPAQAARIRPILLGALERARDDSVAVA